MDEAQMIISRAMQVKDQNEISLMTKSASLCAYLMKKFVQNVLQSIDKAEKVYHIHLQKQMARTLSDPIDNSFICTHF
jgi:nucleosome binding factor SPN SPT16 subunit